MASFKSNWAFRFTCEYLYDRGDVWLWTFTFKEKMDDKHIGFAYRKFQQDIVRLFHGNVGGVRVFEPHPGGHGLHVHALLNRWVPVGKVRRLARKHGLGRVNVKQVKDRGTIDYLAKYLTKNGLPVQKGVRKWAPFGSVRKVRVRAVHVESSETEHMKVLAAGKKLSFTQYLSNLKYVRATGFR